MTKTSPIPRYAVGSLVFDMPTQAIQTITKVETIRVDGHNCVIYYVTGPDNPTGDSAFNGGSRNDFEVCSPDETLPLGY